MARNRMLNPEFWLDEEIATISPMARLLYMGLWGICDDNYATFPNRPAWIKVQVFPYDSVNTQELLIELWKSGKIILFTADDGKEYYYIKNFFKYQKVDKPSKPKYPQLEESRIILAEDSTNTLAEEKISKVKISKENISADAVLDKPKPPVRERSEKQLVYDRVLRHYRETTGVTPPILGKQYDAIASMLRAGFSEDQIIKTITYMAKKDDWYADKGFDLMTVAKQISIYKAKMRGVQNAT